MSVHEEEREENVEITIHVPKSVRQRLNKLIPSRLREPILRNYCSVLADQLEIVPDHKRTAALLATGQLLITFGEEPLQ